MLKYTSPFDREQSVGGQMPTVAVFNDTKAANTAGGTFTTGAWRTRDLNTEVFNNIAGCLLGSPGDILLLHMDGTDNGTTFTDSTGRHIITAQGHTCTKTAVKKFGYSSAYFDGNGDYLSIPISRDFDLGTNDFTIDFWWRTTDASAYSAFFQDLTGYTYWIQAFYHHLDRRIELAIMGTDHRFDFNPSSDTWYHIAFVRSGTQVRVYANGVALGVSVGGTNSSDIVCTGNVSIGSAYGTTFCLGYIDEFRISKGIARWTSNFTPPVEPYAIPVLMLHCDGEDNGTVFTDSSESAHAFVAAGQAVTKTDVKKFGTASILFDGSDSVYCPDSSNFDFGTGDFTIDFWYYPTAFGTIDTFVTKYTAGGVGWIFDYINSTNLIRLWHTGAANVSVSYTFSTGSWYHVAVVRFGSAIKFFVNGTQVGADQTANSTYNGGATWLSVGNYSHTLLYGVTGYLDEFRIVKGLAKWTESFTPASESYPEIFSSYGANSVTLPAGSYLIEASAPASDCNHKAKLYNITDAADVVGCVGTSEDSLSSGPVNGRSIIEGSFTIESQKVFEIQHRGSATVATTGFGVPTNVGVSEIYTQVCITKLP